MKENSGIVNKKFGVFFESLKLPTGVFVEYACFRSNVKLDVVVNLMRNRSIRNWLKDDSVYFKESFQNVKGEFRPRVQVCAAFEISSATFSEFETIFMECMNTTEINRLYDKRKGGTFLEQSMNKFSSASFELSEARSLLTPNDDRNGRQSLKDLFNRVEEHIKQRQQCHEFEMDSKLSAHEANQDIFES